MTLEDIKNAIQKAETIAILVIATLFIAAIVFRKRSRIK